MLLAALFATAASAAVITDFSDSPVDFTFPPGRTGWTGDKAATAPCGGAPVGVRTKYPLTGGEIAMAQKTKADDVTLLYARGNPTRFHDFATFGKNTIEDLGVGHFCTSGPNFASLGFKAGDEATLLTIYNLDDGKQTYYHCADVELVDTASFTKPKYACGNYTTELEVADDDDSVSLTAGPQGSLPAGHAATPNTAVAAATSSVATAPGGGATKAGVAGVAVLGAAAALLLQ